MMASSNTDLRIFGVRRLVAALARGRPVLMSRQRSRRNVRSLRLVVATKALTGQRTPNFRLIRACATLAS